MLKVAGVSIPLKLSQLKTVRKRGGRRRWRKEPMEEGAHGENYLLSYT